MVRQAPLAGWQLQGSTRRQTVLTGLESGKQYWVKVAAVGTRNQWMIGPEQGWYVR